jgi:chemotaxis protein MotD
LITTARDNNQNAGASQNTDSGANAAAAAGSATTAADAANTASNATTAPPPAAPADAPPVAANFQQTLNQTAPTPTQADTDIQASSATITAHTASATEPTEAAGPALQAGATTKTAATNVPTFGIAAANITAATTQTTTTAATTATEPTVSLAGLPVAIASRAQAGSSQFDIRLDPPELGRIEVQLSVDSNGQVVSHITADRQDTLNLLQSQQPQLQQALEQAGLKTSDSAMQFSLRDQSFAGQQQQNQNFAQNGNNSQSNTQQIVIPDSSLSAVDTTQIYSRLNLRGGLDIRV